MKIYISGQISGLPFGEVLEKFDDCENLLSEIGFDVVNPLKNGLPRNSTWRQHMVRDIEMLLDCDAIYMMDNFNESKGARIEYFIAKENDLIIYREGDTKPLSREIIRIQDAIREVTGLSFKQYATKSRQQYLCYARMLFIHHCSLGLGMSLNAIGALLHRDHTSIHHLKKKYKDDYRFNGQFRGMANAVDAILRKSK